MKKLLINVHHHYQRCALLEKDDIDFFLEIPKRKGLLDSLYIGRVLKVFPFYSFVEIGLERPGLLLYEKGCQRPCEGDYVLVQITREEMPDFGEDDGIKGVQLTRKLVLTNRYLCYHPYKKRGAFSSKIIDVLQKERLQNLFTGIEGISFRYNAQNATDEELLFAYQELKDRFEFLVSFKRTAVSQLLKGPSFLERTIRDKDLEIICDHLSFTTSLKAHYSLKDLFEEFDLEEKWESLFSKKVPLYPQGNIVIESTSCLHSLDINQGGAKHTINQEALPLIAQHLKWRRLSGNIVIDFMDGQDMTKQAQQKIIDQLKHYLKKDIISTQFLGWSPLGWLEIRREKRFSPFAFLFERYCR
ncbi:MAG: ribonuclease E/G [Proteobacteria bacterium]|nr:ribonuclease E/G [Pseudomonadota bacterium]